MKTNFEGEIRGSDSLLFLFIEIYIFRNCSEGAPVYVQLVQLRLRIRYKLHIHWHSRQRPNEYTLNTWRSFFEPSVKAHTGKCPANNYIF